MVSFLVSIYQYCVMVFVANLVSIAILSNCNRLLTDVSSRITLLWHISISFSKTSFQRLNQKEMWPDCYLSSSCTGRNQSILPSFLLQPVCHCGNQPAAGGTEWVAQGQRSSPQVKLLHGRSSHLHAWVSHFVRRVQCKDSCWVFMRSEMRQKLRTKKNMSKNHKFVCFCDHSEYFFANSVLANHYTAMGKAGSTSMLYKSISGKDTELTSSSLPSISCQGMSGQTNWSP